ncbi:hypothetical protein LI88_08545 [Streptococcus suis]|nr:hypothetical protein A9494_04495 [Streptococcus suis]PNS44732.1 hypothetical protein LI88_08545 [Streptococcus suis]
MLFSIHIEESQCELIFQAIVQFRIDELEKQKAKFNKRNKENQLFSLQVYFLVSLFLGFVP